ncbi:hypothetical protein FZ103_16385 [Streptomonospora sp. PA3]|uniref:hypothetical protein n=1 Tax=Streptomonospora sp. PA3 TaxID=2607326 RepID=UPI0012DDB610|nr:hypothetical protein [Streptomonospora sp. PA3]MUL42728.1 hypothetical protein [Streptomonospora sp. PA3]
MSASTAFASLRWRIMRHGPNDERGFGLVAGLAAAAGVIALAVLARAGAVHPSWLTAAVSLFGLTWLVGPILLPGSSPVLDPQWFRTLPRRPITIAREMAASEAISVGTLITAVALSSMLVVAAPHGPAAVAVAAAAAAAQLYFLLWLGRCAAAVVGRLLSSTPGMWVAALQMSVLLAVSFAGWVPLMALVLPDLGEGGTEVVVPPVSAAVPAAVEDALLGLPTGWGLAAVGAATSSDSFIAAAMPLAGLVAGGAVLRAGWIALTAHTLSRPPARAQSSVTAGRSAALAGSHGGGAVRAVTVRELKTWFRDPHRKLGLGHAWITPLLMILLVAPTDWTWALPFIGVMAAVLGAMVAVNTYSLDGTALWQPLTTPGAIRADVRGRQAAWMLLFGTPVLAGTVLLCLLSRSPLWAVALGMTLAATGAACAGAPLLSALMPAIGADARERVSTADRTGNAGGGQWTVFTAVAAVAAVPAVAAHLGGAGSLWPVHLALGIATGAAAVLGLSPLTQRYLRRSGPALLSAMAAGDPARLRSAPPARS